MSVARIGAAAAWVLLIAAHAAVAAPSEDATGPEVRLTDHGARCDGSFDNGAALASAIAAARERKATLRLPAAVCAYGDVIRLDGVRLQGEGRTSVLYSLDWRRAAIFMSGTSPEVRDLTLTGQLATGRQADWEMTRITVKGASRFVIDSVTVQNSSAAGIQTSDGAHHGRITRNTIRDTLSDGIHMTDGAAHIEVEDNVIDNSGDDGIAVVSYRADKLLSHHITARRNTVSNNRHGRSMSVVGGTDVLYEDNTLSNSGKYACLYVAQESSYKTFGVERIVLRRNRLSNCASFRTSHAAIMVFNSGEAPNTDVDIVGNDISQRGVTGIRVLGPLNRSIRLDGNTIRGALRSMNLEGDGVTVLPGAKSR